MNRKSDDKQSLPAIVLCTVFLTVPAFSQSTEVSSGGRGEVEQRIGLIQYQYREARKETIDRLFEEKLRQLDLGYLQALDRELENTIKAGRLEDALAVRKEKETIAEASGVPASDDPGTPAEIATLRATYRAEHRKLEAERKLGLAPLAEKLAADLAAYQTLLTREGRLDDALMVKAARENPDMLQSTPAGPVGGNSSALPLIFEEGILGHVVGDPASLRHFPENANLVMDGGWVKNGDETIREARKLGLRVVLQFRAPELAEAESVGIPLALANRDVVIGMGWYHPYYDGKSPDDLSRFGKALKDAAPGLQFWGLFVEKPRGRHQTKPVPPEIDVLVITSFGARNGAKLNEKADDCYSRWMEKGGTRPVIALWSAWAPNPPGLVPNTEPGTMEALVEIRDRFGMKGLIIDHFGEVYAHDGLETSRALLREIEKLNRKPQSMQN
jgi:hypothetical protein